MCAASTTDRTVQTPSRENSATRNCEEQSAGRRVERLVERTRRNMHEARYFPDGALSDEGRALSDEGGGFSDEGGADDSWRSMSSAIRS